MNKNEKNMPKTLKLSLFLLILGMISGGLLAVVNNYTKDIIEQNALNEAYRDIIDVGIIAESIKEVETSKEEGIEKIYRGNNLDNIPCYIFVVNDKNAYTTVKTIIVVEVVSEKIVGMKVLPGATTHNFDNKFVDNDFGVVGESIYDSSKYFEVVTGATASSNSVKNCLTKVEQQIALMGGKIVIKSYSQRLPEYTNFEYVFEIRGTKVSLLLEYNDGNKTFKYLNTLNGNLTDDEISECVALAQSKMPTNIIRNVYKDSTGTTLTLVTDKGYMGEIVAEAKIYNNQIVSFKLISSKENYHKNPDYTYDGNVEDYIFEQYSLGIKNTVVTGATVTSKAINYLLLLADEYINSLGGTK
ncbi:MAG: FMN-binding protein [Bacilli bacterium]|nr:FMN-binding protein [Bacilli bacterium]